MYVRFFCKVMLLGRSDSLCMAVILITIIYIYWFFPGLNVLSYFLCTF